MKAETDPKIRFAAIRGAAARRPHGTRAKYATGCHCDRCRAANSRYESERQRARTTGDWNGIVPVDRARAHLSDLSAKGIGRHSVRAASGISEGILCNIIYGRRKHIRARTEGRILAVDEGAARAKTLISAKGTWKLIDELIARGVPKVQIAEWLGNERALQLRKRRVTAGSAAKVRRAYELFQSGELQSTPARDLRAVVRLSAALKRALEEMSNA